jgi:hypothetical protein
MSTPKYYTGLINIEAQSGSNVDLGQIYNYTYEGDIRTYDLTHLIPSFDAQNSASLTTFELEYPPIKDSFMLILDGLVLSPAYAVPVDQQGAGDNVIGDYRFTDEKTIELLFNEGISRNSAGDTPVLLARYARK